VASHEEFDDAPDVTSGEFPADSNALAKHLRDVLAMNSDEYYELEAKARGRAFTVSGVAELDLVTDVWRAIESAVENGETLEDFKARIGSDLEEAWGGEIPGRLETIFRTNVQSAYAAGRYHQNNRPEVRATHPYSRFTAVLDSRTSDICEALDGTVLHSDDPFWATHQPPLHFNCRSDVSAITVEEAHELGVDEVPPEMQPDDGFGVPITDWKPDLSTRPVELGLLYELKLHEQG
jgi:SPP1 gp7 family putative phage head morphogenesis protein